MNIGELERIGLFPVESIYHIDLPSALVIFLTDFLGKDAEILAAYSQGGSIEPLQLGNVFLLTSDRFLIISAKMVDDKTPSMNFAVEIWLTKELSGFEVYSHVDSLGSIQYGALKIHHPLNRDELIAHLVPEHKRQITWLSDFVKQLNRNLSNVR